MWFKKEKAAPEELGGQEEQLILNANDSLRQRIEKAFLYAGLGNPNRLGIVDKFYFIFAEYERLDEFNKASKQAEGIIEWEENV